MLSPCFTPCVCDQYDGKKFYAVFLKELRIKLDLRFNFLLWFSDSVNEKNVGVTICGWKQPIRDEGGGFETYKRTSIFSFQSHSNLLQTYI